VPEQGSFDSKEWGNRIRVPEGDDAAGEQTVAGKNIPGGQGTGQGGEGRGKGKGGAPLLVWRAGSRSLMAAGPGTREHRA